MKLFLVISIVLFCNYSFAQDSTYKCKSGSVEVKRIGLGNIHTVEVERNDAQWISGKVKRVNYEYMYVRTFQGSTQPANPTEFYKPIKAKSFYYVPVSDIVISYSPNGPVFQTFYLDSLTLKSYFRNGVLRDIYYLNADLCADSIYRFYENGKLRSKIISDPAQTKGELVLNMNYDPEMGIRNSMFEWFPETQMTRVVLNLHNDYEMVRRYPKKQYYCHGNGNPNVVITWHKDSVDANKYRMEYEFFDPMGKVLDSNRISANYQWTGVKYTYDKSGALEWVADMCDDRFCGKTEYWNLDSTINKIEYNGKYTRDSIVYFKQLKDTLLTWRGPMHFEWSAQNTLTKVTHKYCELGFGNDGNVRYSSFEGKHWESYENYGNEHKRLAHFGATDALGFPHGPWFGINSLNDTVYQINYHHGWLHGPYRASNSDWRIDWTRNFNMGKEIDSSILISKGHISEIHYFSDPGKLVKKAMYYNGQLNRIDTLVIGEKFIRLRTINMDGVVTEVSRVDTTLKQIYTKQFFAKDSLKMEIWKDYYENWQESKEYYRETGALKEHWKSEGWITKTEENPKPDEVPKKSNVRLAFRWTYDEVGNLTKTERLENGIVVE